MNSSWKSLQKHPKGEQFALVGSARTSTECNREKSAHSWCCFRRKSQFWQLPIGIYLSRLIWIIIISKRWWLFSASWRSLFGKSREIFTIPASNGRNKLRTHTVDYRELFKLRRKLRSERCHLRITLNVICFMLTIFFSPIKLNWCRVSMAHDPMDDHPARLIIFRL